MAGPQGTPVKGNIHFSTYPFRSIEANRFPRGTLAYSTKTTSSALLTSTTAEFTVTWTAESSRVYLLTYYEPDVKHTTFSGPVDTDQTIRVTNAAGAQVALTRHNRIGIRTRMLSMKLLTGLSGSVTYAGCLLTASLTGTPTANRDATQPAYMMVEDIGGY